MFLRDRNSTLLFIHLLYQVLDRQTLLKEKRSENYPGVKRFLPDKSSIISCDKDFWIPWASKGAAVEARKLEGG